MNTFESYKDQCYNIGSPSPNPKKSPLKKFSKNVESEFNFDSPKTRTPRPKALKASVSKSAGSKLPITLSTSKKRSLDSSNKVTSSPKKLKMDELRDMFLKQNKDQQAFMEKLSSRMDNLYEKLEGITDDNKSSNNAIQTNVAGVESSIKELQSSVDDNRVKFEEKFIQLESQFDKFQENALNSMITTKEDIREAVIPVVEELVPQIKEDIKKELAAPLKATWSAIQADKVKDHEHAIIPA